MQVSLKEIAQRLVALAESHGWTFEDTCRYIADYVEARGGDPRLVVAIRALPKADRPES